MEKHNFSNIIINGLEYKINSEAYPGSNYVRDLININNSNDVYVIKILIKEGTKDRKRFEEEIRFLKNDTTEYFCKVIVDGEILDKSNKKYRYYVMPKYNESLARIIKENKLPNFYSRIQLFLKLCNAVKTLHDKGIIHRDIKPDNILVDGDTVILCDLGISHFPSLDITEDNERLANSNYCAPEQRKKPYGPYGKYTDIYPLGLILNELFTNEIPSGTNYKKIRDVAPAYGVFDACVSNMLEHDYQKRETDIDNFIYIISSFLKNKDKQTKNIISSFKYYLGKSGNKHLFKGLADDIIALYSLVENEEQFKFINFNFHNNYHCCLADGYIKNVAIIKMCLNFIESKFDYENRRYMENLNLGINEDVVSKKERDELAAILKKYSCMKTESYINKIKRLFSYLFERHGIEYLKEIKKKIEEVEKDLSDAPLFYIAYRIYKITNDKDLIKQLGYHIIPLIDKSLDIKENNNIFVYGYDDKDGIRELFKKTFKRNVSVLFNFNKLIVVFKTKVLFSEFKKMCSVFVKNNENFKCDIVDMLNKKEVVDNKIGLLVDEYDLFVLMPKIISFCCDDSK